MELGFGGIKQEADPASIAQPLVLTAGESQREIPPLRLWGKIDRVDIDREGRFIIYDYKSGNPPQQKAIKEGKLLQLPLYLLAVGRLFLPTAEPVGAAYYSLKQADRRRGIWRKETLNFGFTIRGALADPDWEQLLEHSIDKALSYYRGILRVTFPLLRRGNVKATANSAPSVVTLGGGGKMRMKLNKQQRAAVTRLDKDLLVMAGAGTGKTRVLTQKYLYLLQTKVCEVPQIVAVTFTRKAAAEMKARIRQQLKKEYAQSTGDQRMYWSRQLEWLEVAAQITTIHGLCFSLLTQHPVEGRSIPKPSSWI